MDRIAKLEPTSGCTSVSVMLVGDKRSVLHRTFWDPPANIPTSLGSGIVLRGRKYPEFRLVIRDPFFRRAET